MSHGDKLLQSVPTGEGAEIGRPSGWPGRAAAVGRHLPFWTVCAGVIWAMTTPSAGELPVLFPQQDKLLHLAAFFLIGVVGRMTYWRAPRWSLYCWLVIAAGAIEALQLIPQLQRQPDVVDFVCNAAGLLLGMGTARLLRGPKPQLA